jgi:hypothetical protein
VQEEGHDREADDLRDEVRPVHPELVAVSRRHVRRGEMPIHKRRNWVQKAQAEPARAIQPRDPRVPSRVKLTWPYEEDRVEDDRFGERDGQDRLHQDLRRGAGIAPDRFGGLHANEPHADGRAQRGETDVQCCLSPPPT